MIRTSLTALLLLLPQPGVALERILEIEAFPPGGPQSAYLVLLRGEVPGRLDIGLLVPGGSGPYRAMTYQGFAALGDERLPFIVGRGPDGIGFRAWLPRESGLDGYLEFIVTPTAPDIDPPRLEVVEMTLAAQSLGERDFWGQCRVDFLRQTYDVRARAGAGAEPVATSGPVTGGLPDLGTMEAGVRQPLCPGLPF